METCVLSRVTASLIRILSANQCGEHAVLGNSNTGTVSSSPYLDIRKHNIFSFAVFRCAVKIEAIGPSMHEVIPNT
jgi:hypothetical protein